MENKINISQLLKDCPKGMELSSPVYKNLTYDYVDEEQARIYCKVDSRDIVWFSIFGCVNLSPNAKCVIFPKGKTTWKGFVPFVEGDIIYTMGFIAILSNITEKGVIWFHCYCCIDCETFKAKLDTGIGSIKNGDFRLATEEEKQKLFQAIKDNGYKWNPETKTLEKLLKFKVGDRIKHKCENFRDERTIVSYGKSGYWTSTNDWIAYENQDDWTLVPNKFDINTLVPFESRVLVRDGENQYWRVSFWGCFFKSEFMYDTARGRYKQCIPYEGNEHLLGKKGECEEFYKTWE